MDLGTVVVSYNTRQLTLECLASVYRDLEGSNLAGQLWVLDNASGDGSAAAIAQTYPQATVIAGTENLGFARAVNYGMALVDSLDDPPPYVLLLNPDTIVHPDAIREMLACLRSNPRVAAVGAQLLYGDGSFQHGAFHFPTLLMALFDFWTINHRLVNSRLNGRYPLTLYRSSRPFAIDHPLGAAMMIRREAWKIVGALDPGYFMYCEEIDWCMRAKRLGWSIYCTPQAHITHYAGQSANQYKANMVVALWRSRYRLFIKHYTALYRILVRLIVRAGMKRQINRTRYSADTIGSEKAMQMIAAYRQVMEL
ncbi:MAG: glycosyltransferase family 2 protein [Anaerolineae bacterium]